MMIIDRLSNTWLCTVKSIDADLDKLNKRLISPSIDFAETQYIRGCINTLLKIKGLPDVLAIPKIETDDYN